MSSPPAACPGGLAAPSQCVCRLWPPAVLLPVEEVSQRETGTGHGSWTHWVVAPAPGCSRLRLTGRPSSITHSSSVSRSHRLRSPGRDAPPPATFTPGRATGQPSAGWTARTTTTGPPQSKAPCWPGTWTHSGEHTTQNPTRVRPSGHAHLRAQAPTEDLDASPQG